MLFSAMSKIDRETGLPRGLMVLSRQKLTDSVLFMVKAEGGAWQRGRDALATRAPGIMALSLADAKRAQAQAGSCSMVFNLPKVVADMALRLPAEVADR